MLYRPIIKDCDKNLHQLCYVKPQSEGNRTSFFRFEFQPWVMSCIIVSPIEFLLWCGMYQLSLCILNPVDHMESFVFFFKKKKGKNSLSFGSAPGSLLVCHWLTV